MAGIEVLFGCGLTGHSIPHSSSGGDDQGTIGSDERGAESLDGALVHLAISHELREVVVEGAVNYAFRFGCSVAQTFEILEIPPMHFRTGGYQSLGPRIGSR